MKPRSAAPGSPDAPGAVGREAIKDAFVEALGGASLPIEEIFEHLPGVSFWVKNRDLRFVMGTQSFFQLCGRFNADDIIGLTDLDLFPAAMADKFRQDDRTVMKTGRKLLNLVELVPNSDGTVDWYSTNKFPVFGPGLDSSVEPVRQPARQPPHQSTILGVAGTTRLLRKAGRILQPYQELSEVIEFINQNHAASLEVRAIAKRAGISLSQLERRFKELLQITPAQFITKVRLTAACRALAHSRDPISQIARASGFYDASHFCRVFVRHIGMTPTEYRTTFVAGRGLAA